METNLELKNFIASYFNENIERVEDMELKKDCQDLFNNGRTVEKIQVLTLLSALKLYF
jgi:asparagine synthase (glutamine-hydrolysing)